MVILCPARHQMINISITFLRRDILTIDMEMILSISTNFLLLHLISVNRLQHLSVLSCPGYRVQCMYTQQNISFEQSSSIPGVVKHILTRSPLHQRLEGPIFNLRTEGNFNRFFFTILNIYRVSN